MRRIDLYKQLYNDEIARKNYQNSKITTTIIFISLFITGIGVAIFEISKITEKGALWHISAIILFIALIIFIISIYFAYRTYFGYTYLFLTPQEIDMRFSLLIKHYDHYYDEYYSQFNQTKEQLIEKDLEDGLNENYIEAAKNNFINNNRKAKYYKTFSNTIIIALLTLALDLLILYIIQLF